MNPSKAQKQSITVAASDSFKIRKKSVFMSMAFTAFNEEALLKASACVLCERGMMNFLGFFVHLVQYGRKRIFMIPFHVHGVKKIF